MLGFAISYVPHQDLEPSFSVADHIISLQVNTGFGLTGICPAGIITGI